MSIARLMQMAAAGAGGEYQISRSLRFNSADSAYLSRTPASAGNRKTWTWSGWLKRSQISGYQYFFSAYTAATDAGFFGCLFADPSNTIQLIGGVQTWRATTQVFRDASAWYHVVVAVDTTQATPNNRVRLYINGSEVTAFSVTNNPNLNDDLGVNGNWAHTISSNTVTPNQFFNGYMTEINFIDGQALTPSSFGEINPDTGVWQPIKYAGTYGTNGFYLNFSDNTSTTTLGEDQAGSNNWTLNNFSVTAGAGNDSLVDTPTPYGTDTGAGGEVRGNYCTLNPLDQVVTTLTNGNLDAVIGTAASPSNMYVSATTGASSGKYYWEVTLTTITSQFIFGVGDASRYSINLFVTGVGYQGSGEKYINGADTAYGASYANGDVVGVALDLDGGTVTFYKNGASQGAITLPSGISAWKPTFTNGTRVLSQTFVTNFGQRPFAYTAPSGFKALVTTNLPDPTVVQGDDYFNTVLYTGTGTTQSITGVGFQPDFVWIKERNAAADHALYDAVRGVQQQLESNTTTDETTESTGLTAFGSDGFTVGSLAQVNTSTDTYVAWNWKESTVSKFDIVTYTGNGTARTISHNLGVVPNMIIVKARTTASTDQGWPVYHSANTANPETDYLLLNDTAATADLDTVWNDTAPTSSVFSVGTNALVNANNDTYVAYVFANVAGYSAFGSYTGNGSTDGPFVYTGFRPAFVMFKQTSGAGDWVIEDVARSPTNEMDARLFPSTSDQETSNGNGKIDYLSNGFKLRNAHTLMNASGSTYIYMAFATSPFKFALAR